MLENLLFVLRDKDPIAPNDVIQKISVRKPSYNDYLTDFADQDPRG